MVMTTMYRGHRLGAVEAFNAHPARIPSVSEFILLVSCLLPSGFFKHEKALGWDSEGEWEGSYKDLNRKAGICDESPAADGGEAGICFVLQVKYQTSKITCYKSQ